MYNKQSANYFLFNLNREAPLSTYGKLFRLKYYVWIYKTLAVIDSSMPPQRIRHQRWVENGRSTKPKTAHIGYWNCLAGVINVGSTLRPRVYVVAMAMAKRQKRLTQQQVLPFAVGHKCAKAAGSCPSVLQPVLRLIHPYFVANVWHCH